MSIVDVSTGQWFSLFLTIVLSLTLSLTPSASLSLSLTHPHPPCLHSCVIDSAAVLSSAVPCHLFQLSAIGHGAATTDGRKENGEERKGKSLRQRKWTVAHTVSMCPTFTVHW